MQIKHLGKITLGISLLSLLNIYSQDNINLSYPEGGLHSLTTITLIVSGIIIVLSLLTFLNQFKQPRREKVFAGIAIVLVIVGILYISFINACTGGC